FIAAAVLRRSRRQPARSATDEDIPNDPYAISYLAGGPVRMAESALSELLRAGALQIGAKGKIQATTAAPAASQLHPVEAQLLAQFSPHVGKSFASVQKQLTSLPDVITEDLRERGLILGESTRSSIRNTALTLALLAPGLGLIKLMIGISRDRPVGFLVVGLVITTILAVALFGRKPLRSRLGDNVLRRLKEQYAGYRMTGALEAGSGLSQGALATTVGLFGMSMLANTVHANEYARLRQSYQSSTGDSGSSGCGSSGDSGSDGGSGCGGGCGGCGGGGD
ncbi:MAG: TIGR04222 domain-containing membrane protein, partial [Verrucomicrobiaceae bacterium]